MYACNSYCLPNNDIACIYSFPKVRSDVSVFEINIRFVGGLLSAYALSKDEVRTYHVDGSVQVATVLCNSLSNSRGYEFSYLVCSIVCIYQCFPQKQNKGGGGGGRESL